jgi:hypothetical protein
MWPICRMSFRGRWLGRRSLRAWREKEGSATAAGAYCGGGSTAQVKCAMMERKDGEGASSEDGYRSTYTSGRGAWRGKAARRHAPARLPRSGVGSLTRAEARGRMLDIAGGERTRAEASRTPRNPRPVNRLTEYFLN